jgi:TetR/AcrR family transcriptional repressor of nem operon
MRMLERALYSTIIYPWSLRIMNPSSTRDQLIALAQRLIQTRGYNGFSYRDLANLVGIKTASIHYYFPQKEDLLLAVVDSYRACWRDELAALPQHASAAERLRGYFALCERILSETDGVTLGSALATDLMSLPESVRAKLQDFYRANETWLAGVLEQGNQDGSLPTHADPGSAAQALYAAIQGALISARLFNKDDRLSCLRAVLNITKQNIAEP